MSKKLYNKFSKNCKKSYKNSKNLIFDPENRIFLENFFSDIPPETEKISGVDLSKRIMCAKSFRKKFPLRYLPGALGTTMRKISGPLHNRLLMR